MFNREFFGGDLDPDDRILSDADLNRCRYDGKGCDALPAEWHDAQSRENKALSWFNAMATTLYPRTSPEPLAALGFRTVRGSANLAAGERQEMSRP